MNDHSRSRERDACRAAALADIPGWYSPWFHLVVPSAIALAALGFALRGLVAAGGPGPWQWIAVPLGIAQMNAVERWTHRHLLHRRRRGWGGLFTHHNAIHHGVYHTDDMAMRSAAELRFVLLPASVVTMLFTGMWPIPLVLFAAGHAAFAWLLLVTTYTYYLWYEWVHLLFHLPDSRLTRSRPFRVLSRHHAEHHDPSLMLHWNHNVTLPLWDVLMGTFWWAGRPRVAHGQGPRLRQASRRAARAPDPTA